MTLQPHKRSSQSKNYSPRTGFSLIELIVVIGIIALLLAIILPAVQMARESARNAQCKSQMGQFGKAIFNHSSQFGRLPKDGARGWGYGVFLLPQIEQTALFDLISPQSKVQPPAVDPQTTGQALAIFVCPSFPGESHLAAGYGRSTARGSAGVFSRSIQLTDIVDGQSNTIAIGETKSDLGWALPGVADGNSGPNQGDAFGSHHSGGANFLFCDGSVAFIQDEVDTTMFKAMFTTAGGEPVSR